MNLDFGRIGLYQPKHRSVNVTNIGHETVLLDWIHKNNEFDELSITFEDSYDDLKQLYPNLKPKYFDEDQTKTVVDRFHQS